MTTEKEFWEFTSRYFRTVVSIQNIIDELKVSGGLSKDVRAIKAMKGVENIMKEFDEQNQKQSSIDEGCVGCAGPCKVVDVAAKLQKELDSCLKTIETKETDRLHEIVQNMDVTISDLMDNDRKMNGFLDEYRATVDNRDKTIEELKDKNIEDLHELYDLYEKELGQLKHVISARDLTIKSLTTMCQSSGTERNGLQKEIDRMEKVHANRKAHINNLTSAIEGLEAELSARKEDSEVLMKVVEIVKNWDDSTGRAFPTLIKILDELVDYTDAPEGPPETPIDDLYKVTVTYAFLELP